MTIEKGLSGKTGFYTPNQAGSDTDPEKQRQKTTDRGTTIVTASPLWPIEVMTGAAARTLVLVRNGCYLPNKWIRHRFLTLNGLCRTHGLVLFIPIFHREGRGLPRNPESIFILRVPSFKETPRKELRTLTVELLHERNPDLTVESCQQMALQLIEAGPNSRTELQQWVDYYSAKRQLMPSEVVWPPPELPKLAISAPRWRCPLFWTILSEKFSLFWRCPLFWTILSEKFSLFSIYGFMVYSACPPGG
jgi:hypothetical protein